MALVLHQSVGPNPRVVLMFVEEKGMLLERRFVDVVAGESRRPPFTDMNPFGQTPVLEIDGSAPLSESIAICEYLEERQANPPVIGKTAEERAETRMLVRRIDSDVVTPLTIAFRGSEGLPIFRDRMRCVPEGADTLKACARDGMERFDEWMDGRRWLAGDRFTLSDILLFAFLDFGRQVGQPLPDGFTRLADWFARVAERPSALASADPKVGMAEAV